MSDIQLRSLQDILGAMIAQIQATTDVNAVQPGSVLMTILEAAASSDFVQESKLIQILNTRDIDQATGTDLEALAFESGLSPTRIGSNSATVSLTIEDAAFSKLSTNVYAGSAAPVAGDTTINVVDASGFLAKFPAGTIYIGRGTNTAEAVRYSTITLPNPLSASQPYYVLNLASPLTKDHLVGEEVVVAQGGDRRVPAGTSVQAQAQSGFPAIIFNTQYDAYLLDGEDTLTGVSAQATTPGSSGNVGAGKINSFQGAPWSSAIVTNPDAAVGGLDPESDSALRQRIKDYVYTLSGGTERALIRAVVGVYDDSDDKRVVSAYLRKPTNPGDPTILFIDDGTGFEPSFSGVGQEVIVNQAAGTERFLQLQQFPLVKAQVASVLLEPFDLLGGEYLAVTVDGVTEQAQIPGTGFKTPGVVSAQEVAQAINGINPSTGLKAFTTIEARAKNGQLFITPVADEPNYIQVGSTTTGIDANTLLQFPLTKQYTLKLYQNDQLLNKNGSPATIQSLSFSQFNSLGTSETLQFTVDGILGPSVTITDTDFANNTSARTIVAAQLADWATILNLKFIGITALVNGGVISVSSNKGAVTGGALSVTGGSLIGKIFPIGVTSTAVQAQYKLNRLSGQIELLMPVKSGDSLKAGTINTRGMATSPALSSFSLASTADWNGGAAHNPEMVLVADATYTKVALTQSGTLTFSNPASGVQRITSSVSGAFSNVLLDDWVHLFNCPRNGIYRVVAVDPSHNYVDLSDPAPVSSGAPTLNGTTTQARIFRTQGLPQLWTLPTGTTVSAATLQTSVLSQILGVNATILASGALQISTTRFLGTGALSVASVAGSATNLGIAEGSYGSSDPHVASVESDNLGGIPTGRITIATPDTSAPYSDLVASGTPFSTIETSNRTLQPYLGSNSGIQQVPQNRVSTSEVILRQDLPNFHVGLGPNYRGTSLSNLEFGQADNMVFILDNDAFHKTFNIPMYVDATIAGTYTPTTTQMDLQDLSGALLGISSRWAGHRFEDYRVWFKAKRDMPSTDATGQLRLTAVQFGPNGEKIRAGFLYPTLPSQAAQATYLVDGANDQITVSITLPSGSPRAINLQPSRKMDVTVSGSTVTYQFLPPVDLSQVQPGDILALSDSAFQSGNQGAMKIATVTNLVDSGHAFTFTTETVSASISASSSTMTFAVAPSQTVRVGDTIVVSGTTYTVTAVGSQTSVTVSPSNSGSTQTSVSSTMTHSNITISSVPGFTAAVGDKIVVGSIVMKITGVASTTEFTVDQPFSFTGLLSGTLSRLTLQGSRYNAGTTESQTLSGSQSVQVYPLDTTKNTAASLLTLINTTSGVLDQVTASNSPTSSGVGSVTKSTEDELASGSKYVSLQNSESFVYSTGSTSPAITLKEAVTTAPSIGESVRLVPATAHNIFDHFSRKQISGLSVSSDISLVDRGRRVQVSSKTPGGSGQVFAVGGRASGTNVLSVRNTNLELSSTRAQIEMDRASMDFLIPGHTIKISQPNRARKKWTGSSPTSATTVTISVSGTTGTLTFGVALASPYTYAQTSPTWAVRKIGRNRLRFEITAGSATIPAGLQMDDWVLIGDGTAYCGTTTDTLFSSVNRGWFQVRETDNSTYFDVENTNGVEEWVATTANSFIFTPYHSARPGDQVVIASTCPLTSSNSKGTFTILSVPSTTSITYTNPNVVTETSVAIGSDTSCIGILDQGFSTYRTVTLVAPKASDPSNRSYAVVSPGTNMALLSEGLGAKITLPARMGYTTQPVPGVSGYGYWTGLKQRIQRIVDGYEPDPINFPGTAAAGVGVQVKEPQIYEVQIAMTITPAKGVSLQALSDPIKSTISGYINSLALGAPVILSTVISLVQAIPGVSSCVLTNPAPTVNNQTGTATAPGQITIGDNALARISASDITLS